MRKLLLEVVDSRMVLEILLRIFIKELEANVSISKKHKRKKHLDEKKKKRKAGKVETHLEFPRREKFKFGEVVEVPPKLSFTKVPSLLTSLYVIRFGQVRMKGRLNF